VVIAGNGEITMKSQMYSSEADARKGVEAVMVAGSNQRSYEVKKSATAGSSTEQPFFFHIQAGNNQNIGSSEMYKREISAWRGVSSTAKSVAKLIEEVSKSDSVAGGGNSFTIKKSSDNKHYFVLSAENNKVIATSETYESKEACVKGMASVLKNGGVATGFLEGVGKDKRPYFVIKAANGEVIANSQMYAEDKNSKAGVDAVKDAVRKIIVAKFVAPLKVVESGSS
jgi:uncharacterized protein YegP (UPF0339 family)